jgi:nicotinate phosphoribosyltransferase
MVPAPADQRCKCRAERTVYLTPPGIDHNGVVTTGRALFTDLYELTMMAGYYMSDMTAPATFELYARDLPPHRSFLIAAGLEQAVEYLEGLHFTADDIRYLRDLPALAHVRSDFFDRYLQEFRFTGELWAVEEGTPIFPPEPILRVTAPLPEAQFVETALLASVSFQTSVASRAARMVEAAAGRPVIEFGSRRAHGLDAGVYAARAAFLAGCEATSNAEAGRRFGIPVSGTMAHSWVMAFPSEMAAFRRYADIFTDRAVMLLDTYDPVAAARSLAGSGLRPGGVRIDSGDVVALSAEVRKILDASGLQDTTIFASGDLDEWRIAQMLEAGAPIDGFGVGAALSTSSDAPSLGAIYKLVEIERGSSVVPIMKLSPGKPTFPGRKQVWRRVSGGTALEDVMGLADEPGGSRGQPLLERLMVNGRRERPSPPLGELRARCRRALDDVPAPVRRLSDPIRYPVRFSEALQATVDRTSRMAL